MTRIWCERAWVEGRTESGVLLEVSDEGTITGLQSGVDTAPEDARALGGYVIPGGVNAHSHAFHRLLRGRTHADGGTFWTWRTAMYEVAARLTPDSYYRVAKAVFAEMLAGGYTSVGEFHYVHHAPDGTPYGGEDDKHHAHAMELALSAAAAEVGIRIRLLDTCYLSSAPGEALLPEQVRFGDGSIEGYLERHASLRARLSGYYPFVTVGAAVHSVRAVSPAEIARFAELDEPVHMHVSEQPAENEACRMAYGKTPVGVLAEAGVLGENFSAVHATHLSESDIAALGGTGSTIVMCPCTEADLADGIGPARALADAGARIALGSDQHVVLDALRETQALEAGERLASGERGRFTPGELLEVLTSGGAASLGLPVGRIAVGLECDLVELEPRSVRTHGSLDEGIVLSATAADIRHVVVGGRTRIARGEHVDCGDLADLYDAAYSAVGS